MNMKQIKLRAFKEGKMYYELMTEVPVKGTEIHVEVNAYINKWNEYGNTYYQSVLMMSTNWFDKNGKEIWEGDITSDGDEIFWWKEKGLWGIRNKEDCDDYLYEFVKSIEIIGNIYENPELIK